MVIRFLLRIPIYAHIKYSRTRAVKANGVLRGTIPAPAPQS
jgi:hypothetical protein